MVALLVIVVALVVFEIAASLFAVDSRDGKDWKVGCFVDDGCRPGRRP